MNQSTQATGVALYGENIPTALGDCPLAVGAIAQYAPFNLASTGYWSLASVTEFEDILLGPAGDPPIVPPPFVYVLDCNGELSINTTTFPLSLNPATPPIVAIQNGIFCSDTGNPELFSECLSLVGVFWTSWMLSIVLWFLS
jgi:hypothetical protein